jgi:ubiquinone biosynthesis protein
MVFRDGLFHGDLHTGNIFVMPENKIGLIDFGLVGRLKGSTQNAIAVLLTALHDEDYERLAYTYIDIAPFNDEVDMDAFARDLRDLIAPYFGLSMKHVNVGRLLMESAAVAGLHGLALPSELILFFKSTVTIEGMAHILMKDFDFLSVSMEFARAIVASRQDPQRVLSEAAHILRDVAAMLAPLPRQVRQILRRWSHPSTSLKIDLVGQEAWRRTIEQSANKIFMGLIIGSLILGSCILATVSPHPLPFGTFLGLAGALALALFTLWRNS